MKYLLLILLFPLTAASQSDYVKTGEYDTVQAYVLVSMKVLRKDMVASMPVLVVRERLQYIWKYDRLPPYEDIYAERKYLYPFSKEPLDDIYIIWQVKYINHPNQ